ncbi:hypothetical protein KEF29_24850 [Streptomyces tuirus]|uniref:Uncharacterized protein n=1 Tax=Streptomyces tuirus TaxID=68278 RepID=A0A941FES8_9ACTN|nr:hypothetical protein [Streptomyces tuirus]
MHEMLSRGALAASQFEVQVRDDGYVVHTEPGTYVLPVLAAVLRGLPEVLTGLVDPPALAVTFWDAPTPPAVAPLVPAGIQVVVSPAVYEEFAASSAAQGPQRFQPLYEGGGAADTPPVAWYCPLSPPPQPPDPTPATWCGAPSSRTTCAGSAAYRPRAARPSSTPGPTVRSPSSTPPGRTATGRRGR